MKINESLRVVQNSNDYLIISETENVWYNKLCTLSTKKLKISLKFVILRCLFSQNDYYIIKYHNVAHFLQSKIIGLSHI